MTVLDFDHLSFSEALEACKQGEHIARSGWNGKGMLVKLVPGQDPCLPFLAMLTVDAKFVPWLASQSDLLANDWYIVAK